MIFKILIMVSLLRLLDVTNKPFLCSGIYASIVLLFGIILGDPIIEVLLLTAIALAIASLYFWLLTRFNDGLAYWGIMLGGLFMVML